MEYSDIAEILSDNGYDATADSLNRLVALAAHEIVHRHDGDAVSALRMVRTEFADRVSHWRTHPYEDLDPCALLESGPLYAYSWAAATLIHRIENPEEELDSDRTEVPDLFLLGMCKANNELSTKVLETAALLEKAVRAEALLKAYAQLDKLLDALNAPRRSVYDTRDLSVIERVEAMHEDLSTVIGELREKMG